MYVLCFIWLRTVLLFPQLRRSQLFLNIERCTQAATLQRKSPLCSKTSYTSLQRAAQAVIDIRFRDRPDISLPPVIDQPFFNGTRVSIRAGLIISASDRVDRGDYICTIVTDHGTGTTTVVLSEGELYLRFTALLSRHADTLRDSSQKDMQSKLRVETLQTCNLRWSAGCGPLVVHPGAQGREGRVGDGREWEGRGRGWRNLTKFWSETCPNGAAVKACIEYGIAQSHGH